MKNNIRIFLVVVTSFILTVGIVRAITEFNITSQFGGTSGDIFDLDGTLKTDSIRIGQQGTGGVTFFNGTIINETTSEGADNPITFGDNVRIDGRVYRGATAGTGDSMPFIVNDNMEVAGTLTVGGLSGADIVGTTNIEDDAITTAKIADDSVTAAKVNGAGGAGLPIAYGYINGLDGSFVAGTSNFTSTREDDEETGTPFYLITIENESYRADQYVTVVSTMADGGWAQVFSNDGRLEIYFQNEAGNFVAAQGFYFLTFRTDAADSTSTSPETFTVRGKQVQQ